MPSPGTFVFSDFPNYSGTQTVMWCPIANGYGFGTRAVMKSHQILTSNSSPPRGTFAWKRIRKDFLIVSLFHRFLFACVKIFGCFLSASETLESRVFTSSKGSIGGTTQSLLGLHDSKKKSSQPSFTTEPKFEQCFLDFMRFTGTT